MTIKLRPSISTLLFDWDGTIVDSAHLGLAAYQKTFAELDAAFSQEIYEATYSPNWYATYEALGLPKEKWSQADDLWQIHYDQEITMRAIIRRLTDDFSNFEKKSIEYRDI